ncbi:hypothetical protein EW146_g7403 [Bondarzewia mesenterica]|uniref:Uncharacterized protein n=1 Tax=Bondarzewia mesenterica TaxID=1095465 RepID=A0A4S4LMP8_9AGAM|nr:hypothetical protein EW146_g7403 [Bondarzewia mesenterica]
MDIAGPDCPTAASQLKSLSHKLPTGGEDEWRQVELSARALANGLRVRNKDVDNHTTLGKTELPQTLTRLLQLTLDDGAPIDARLPVIYELLRVGANLMIEWITDENRGYLLDVEFPQIIVTLLDSYAKSISAGHKTDLLPLSIPDLKVVKTSIGVLLNASMGYGSRDFPVMPSRMLVLRFYSPEPVKSLLISLDAAVTILRLTTAIYPVGSWLKAQPQDLFAENDIDPTPDVIAESWTLRSGLSGWAWRAISELKDDALDLFGPEDLSLLIPPLKAYTPPFPSATGLLDHDAYLRRSLIQADFDVLEEACSLLESLTMDVEDVRLALARGIASPDEHGGVNCLLELLKFIEEGDYHPLWTTDSPAERSRKEKSFDFCKAALIKAVVEIAGEEKNIDVLWDDSDDAAPGGAFVSRMVHWIKSHKNLKEQDRDDLVICATLSLGNLVRYESHSSAIVNKPIALGPYLATLLTPDADMKVKHGVIGLLRHLAYAPPARAPLGEAGIIDRLVASNIFKDTSDIAELVQVSAIGIAKHLCNANAENCFALVLTPDNQDTESSGLKQILSLVRRSDTIAMKSEGTRVFVNIIRTLWSQATVEGERRKKAMDAVTIPAVALTLAQLIGRSKKYPILINEGIVALTLLSLHGAGADYALDAITTPLPQEAYKNSNTQFADTGDVGSPVTAPGRALDMLMVALQGHSARLPEEVRVNVCALLGQIGRAGVVSSERAAELAKLKGEVRPLLETAANTEQPTKLKLSAAKALQLWK